MEVELCISPEILYAGIDLPSVLNGLYRASDQLNLLSWPPPLATPKLSA